MRLILLPMLLLVCACASDAPRLTSVDDVQSAANQTLAAILADLRALSTERPELAEIEGVRVDGARITYSKGLRGPIKAPKARFDEEGCYISVEITVYDPEDDSATVEFLAMSARAFERHETNGGIRYAVWTLVRAASSPEGKEFETRIEDLLSNRLSALQEKLGARPVPGPARK
jgi:hypothetical protein